MQPCTSANMSTYLFGRLVTIGKLRLSLIIIIFALAASPVGRLIPSRRDPPDFSDCARIASRDRFEVPDLYASAAFFDLQYPPPHTYSKNRRCAVVYGENKIPFPCLYEQTEIHILRYHPPALLSLISRHTPSVSTTAVIN